MILKGLNDYDIINYKIPSMFLIFPKCNFKCDKECGESICQNSPLIKEPDIQISTTTIVSRYLMNPLTHAVVCGGLEPFDSWDDLYLFITTFRVLSQDPIIIYTGYYENEIINYLKLLKEKGNIIVKFGRFIPNSPHIFDAILGVELASNNQYARELKEMFYNEYSIANNGENKNNE